ncbi:NAD(+) kinase [Clostridium sp. MCC353]|uniref:NAD(+)/NADH kinase n=1 Tax=Clostridium sp. MCC353 TaxID=2592646 RepID=UPI001C034C2A|nr:NAD(+)/NADH kinase [Clostridium sp. MCC353]MBT9778905.1 NAD(+) kinase [Clostridium sp. MCC353]
MEYFYLIVNPEKESACEAAEAVSLYLRERGAACVIQKNGTGMSGKGYKYTNLAALPPKTQCVITFGGDGTLIQAARDLAGSSLPLVGVNMGRLGYLTQISREEEIGCLLDGLVDDNYQLEKRMMLTGAAYHEGARVYQDIALNEIVITRKDLLKVLRFRLYVNEEFLNEYTADGMIIATPTGSTAYNLSAGGPIVVPDSRMIIVTPICSHSLNARSIVLSADDCIKIRIEGSDARGQVAVFDGDTATDLLTGDYIEIQQAEIDTTLIKLKDVSFMDTLRNKMAIV